MLIYMLIVTKVSPYKEDSEDASSFVSCFALTITLIFGFALISDDHDDPTYNKDIIAIILLC